MRVLVISTSGGPKQNIGDYLITKATVAGVRQVCGPDTAVEAVFREDAEKVSRELQYADAVIFACLAIRKNLIRLYPCIDAIRASGVPFAVIAAGTSLNVSAADLDLGKSLSGEDRSLLNGLAKEASFFATRDNLTQWFCEAIGIANAEMTGDVAFLDRRFESRAFREVPTVRTVAISDPHFSEVYADSLRRLIEELRRLWPEAELRLILHGVNEFAERLAGEAGLAAYPIYEDLEHGLDLYDECDLHVGYRVHGHVSALSRRIPSYLLEQDGRGCGYGLTIPVKASVPSYRPRGTARTTQVDTLPVRLLCSMVRHDMKTGFSRFAGLEAWIQRVIGANLELLGRFRV